MVNFSLTQVEEGNMLKTQRLSKSKLSPMLSGQSLKLREGVYKQLKDREWNFNRAENEIIFLIHKTGVYGVVVRKEDIDWNEC
jgi:hypothetical protein